MPPDSVLSGSHTATAVSSAMSASDIIALLGQHQCPDITDKLVLEQCGYAPISGGGFGDIYHGVLKGGEHVAIKTARLYLQHDDKNGHKILKPQRILGARKCQITRQRTGLYLAQCEESNEREYKFYIAPIQTDAFHVFSQQHAARELYIWSHLKHKNVLDLCGLAQFRDHMAMVSPWMDNGTLLQYIERNPAVDRYQLCIDIVEGVNYLHQNDVVHGDIKSANVLISCEGVVKLADFGCTQLKRGTLYFTTTTSALALSPRWTAPEILNGAAQSSKESDVYAVGMTLLEAVTGAVPFSNYRDQAVYGAVLWMRQVPDRPKSFASFEEDEAGLLWNLITDTWAYTPSNRPDSGIVKSRASGYAYSLDKVLSLMLCTSNSLNS
ncbi:hypothetical protein FRC09_004577 [Ceratobasidium sp. 395]|nr:hypothetical protein FRC09_004577 [Ceratobasidium sp. 395]